VPGKFGQQLDGDRAHDPLHLASALRSGDGGVDEVDVQVHADVGEVVAGEVTAVVGVEDLG
jgi:hypothetical protein